MARRSGRGMPLRKARYRGRTPSRRFPERSGIAARVTYSSAVGEDAIASPNPYQAIVGRLNIDKAIITASASNDLLPPRREDGVGGELGNRFSLRLARDLEQGHYDPVSAHFIAVPKSQYSTRPAALLAFPDRVVYEAIVAALRPRIASSLLDPETVFWPRCSLPDERRWSTFENSALEHDRDYIVRCDVAGFYESIDHDQLTRTIISATGRRELAEALLHLLTRVMNGTRGLPQGLLSSDALAALYLSEVDYAMVRKGFQYVRHGDDVRIAVDSYEDGCSAVRCMEAALRKRGLLLNSTKTRVFRRQRYAESLTSYNRMWEETRKSIIEGTVTKLRKDHDAFESALMSFDLEELGWALFYHGAVDVEEVFAQIRAKITPRDVEVAAHWLPRLLKDRPSNGDRLQRERFHYQLGNLLWILGSAASDAALPSVGDLIRQFPDKTELLCRYVSKLGGREGEIVQQIEGAIGEYTTEWGFAWMMRVLSRMPGYMSAGTVNMLRRTVSNPQGRWLGAVEGAKCLAARNELPRESLLHLWETCPRTFRTDLVVAAVRMQNSAEWAVRFVQSARGNRIHAVVIEHEVQRLERGLQGS